MSEDPLVEIGAHTIHHQALNKLSESVVQKEMEGSRDKIELETGQKVEHFSYPFGKLDRLSYLSEYMAHEVSKEVFMCNGGINRDPDALGPILRIGVPNGDKDMLGKLLRIQWIR